MTSFVDFPLREKSRYIYLNTIILLRKIINIKKFRYCTTYFTYPTRQFVFLAPVESSAAHEIGGKSTSDDIHLIV